MKEQLKLFVWEDVLRDYTSGMVCILAHSLEEAFEMLYKTDGLAWSELQGLWNRLSWDNPEIKKLNDKKKTLMELQKTWLDNQGLKISPFHIKPKVVTKPEAFTVHGGG